MKFAMASNHIEQRETVSINLVPMVSTILETLLYSYCTTQYQNG